MTEIWGKGTNPHDLLWLKLFKMHTKIHNTIHITQQNTLHAILIYIPIQKNLDHKLWWHNYFTSQWQAFMYFNLISTRLNPASSKQNWAACCLSSWLAVYHEDQQKTWTNFFMLTLLRWTILLTFSHRFHKCMVSHQNVDVNVSGDYLPEGRAI